MIVANKIDALHTMYPCYAEKINNALKDLENELENAKNEYKKPLELQKMSLDLKIKELYDSIITINNYLIILNIIVYFIKK